MTARLQFSAAALAELHALPDEALLTTGEAAAFLSLSPSTLSWYRSHRMGPTSQKVGPKSVRYRAGALRQYVATSAPRSKQEG